MSSSSKKKFWGVVPAAGSGQRMQSTVAKQYLEIGGKTIIEHSIEVMLSDGRIDQVVVCVASQDETWTTLGVSTSNRVRTTIGGDSRAQSVLNGLNAIKGFAHDDDWVLVHDAARPCLDPLLLKKIITELQNHDVGGILAVPVKDTLKRSIEAADTIDSTIDRSGVWQAQTPQMFPYKMLLDVISSALTERQAITDEASAIEFAGYKPKLVMGDYKNIKVTTADDLEFAEFLLSKKSYN